MILDVVTMSPVRGCRVQILHVNELILVPNPLRVDMYSVSVGLRFCKPLRVDTASLLHVNELILVPNPLRVDMYSVSVGLRFCKPLRVDTASLWVWGSATQLRVDYSISDQVTPRFLQ